MNNRNNYMFFFLLASVFLTVSCVRQANETQSMQKVPSTYIIVYKTTVDQPNLKSQSLMTQWVDNIAQKYAVQTSTVLEINGSTQSGESLMISRDGWNFVLNLQTKKGFKTKEEKNEKLTKAYLKPAEEETLRNAIESEGGKIRGKEFFLGFECMVAELPERDESGQELNSTIWYYKGIPLKMSNRNYTMEAISFEADIPIPEQHFQVPDDVEITMIPAL